MRLPIANIAAMTMGGLCMGLASFTIGRGYQHDQEHAHHHIAECVTDAQCAAEYPGTNGDPEPVQSVLVGLGCEGPSPAAVAFDEDHLPRCATIERHNLRH